MNTIQQHPAPAETPLSCGEGSGERSQTAETAEIQPAILKLQELGKMPDDDGTFEMSELSGRYDKLLEQVKIPINYQEAEILVKLFPENSLCEVEWPLLHLFETVEISEEKYLELINQCSSEEWRETLTIRFNNYKEDNPAPAETPLSCGEGLGERSQTPAPAEIQPAILKLQELGQMPDDDGTFEMSELSGRYDKLLEQVKIPINYQEAEILVKLFPENSLCEVECTLLCLFESIVKEISEEKYLELINQCSSEEWREYLTIRFNNYKEDNPAPAETPLSCGEGLGERSQTAETAKFDSEKIKKQIIEFAAKGVEKFLQENPDLKFYAFAFDCNAEYAEINLSLNTEEDFAATLKDYQGKSAKNYRKEEDINDLKYNTGDWNYQCFDTLYVFDEDEMDKFYNEMYPAENDDDYEKWNDFAGDLLQLFTESLIEFSNTETFRKIPKTADFTFFAIDHDEDFEDAIKRLSDLQSETAEPIIS